MIRKLISVSAIFLSTCTAGPTDIEEYEPPAVDVRVRFLDLPAEPVLSASLGVYYVTKAGDASQRYAIGGNLTEESAGYASSSLGGDAARFSIKPDSLSGYEARARQAAGSSLPTVRFFNLTASLMIGEAVQNTSAGYAGSWRPPGFLLVYASEATPWALFGPGSPSASFPQGYSWLRRTCGALPGQIEMEVLSIDEVVEFRHFELPPEDGRSIYILPDGRSVLGPINTLEQTFAASCGAALPAADLGTRVSFDRAASLVWSADSATIYYLSTPDDSDPNGSVGGSVGLRQIRVADLVNTELATFPASRSLQVDNSGNLYVSIQEDLYRVVLADAQQATFVPVMPAGLLSPDARQVAYQASSGLRIRDLQTGAEVSVNGTHPTWSPWGELAYWSSSDTTASSLAAMTLHTLRPDGAIQTYPFTYPYSSNTVVWKSAGPLVSSAYVGLPPLDSVRHCSSCFGLSLSDPVTGIERLILDGSAGITSVVKASVVDLMFAWATNCVGLHDTLCSSTLFRVNLADASAVKVASYSIPLPTAVSFDGHHIALAAPNGVYVKELP